MSHQSVEPVDQPQHIQHEYVGDGKGPGQPFPSCQYRPNIPNSHFNSCAAFADLQCRLGGVSHRGIEDRSSPAAVYRTDRIEVTLRWSPDKNTIRPSSTSMMSHLIVSAYGECGWRPSPMPRTKDKAVLGEKNLTRDYANRSLETIKSREELPLVA